MGGTGYIRGYGYAIAAALLACIASFGAQAQPVCGDADAGACLQANGTPACENLDCCELVCQADPFCCDTSWDGICAGIALSIDQCVADAPGACCLDGSGACVEVTRDECEAIGLRFAGPVEICAETECFDQPGWNRVSAEITLTPNQPTYWSAFSGTGSSGVLNPVTVPPFTTLDPDPTGDFPGRPCVEDDDRCLRGYIVAWAVDDNNREIAYDQLSGSATVVNYDDRFAYEYGAVAHQSVGPVNGDGTLDLDGTEYSPGFDLLLMSFFRDDSAPFSTAGTLAGLNGDLTLMPAILDARQGSTPVTTKAVVDLWNENEVKFDGLERCVTCWDQTLFRNYAGFGIPSNFVNLQTDHGKARIDGRAGDGVCDVFDETEGPCGTLSSDICGVDAPLLGVVTHELSFGPNFFLSPLGAPAGGKKGPTDPVTGGGIARALPGMGTQGGSIQYTPLDPPPTATAPERGRTRDGRTALTPRRAPTTPALAGGPIQDRASATEKGSVLFYAIVELRWDGSLLVQDTFISLLNDGNEPVKVQMEFINGDPPVFVGDE